ncbi:hypothetical protein BMAJHU_C0416 [Burkholderia mallei JHU]|nr:hypothetical protein BMAJHU_C0416 [Burkholderia mallei JHU]
MRRAGWASIRSSARGEKRRCGAADGGQACALRRGGAANGMDTVPRITRGARFGRRMIASLRRRRDRCHRHFRYTFGTTDSPIPSGGSRGRPPSIAIFTGTR